MRAPLQKHIEKGQGLLVNVSILALRSLNEFLSVAFGQVGFYLWVLSLNTHMCRHSPHILIL